MHIALYIRTDKSHVVSSNLLLCKL